jgi:hypothetical protein
MGGPVAKLNTKPPMWAEPDHYDSPIIPGTIVGHLNANADPVRDAAPVVTASIRHPK